MVHKAISYAEIVASRLCVLRVFANFVETFSDGRGLRNTALNPGFSSRVVFVKRCPVTKQDCRHARMRKKTRLYEKAFHLVQFYFRTSVNSNLDLRVSPQSQIHGRVLKLQYLVQYESYVQEYVANALDSVNSHTKIRTHVQDYITTPLHSGSYISCTLT